MIELNGHRYYDKKDLIEIFNMSQPNAYQWLDKIGDYIEDNLFIKDQDIMEYINGFKIKTIKERRLNEAKKANINWYETTSEKETETEEETHESIDYIVEDQTSSEEETCASDEENEPIITFPPARSYNDGKLYYAARRRNMIKIVSTVTCTSILFILSFKSRKRRKKYS